MDDDPADVIAIEDVLFLACTRPAMFWGIPIEAAMACMMIFAECGLLLHHWISAAVFGVFALLICRLLAGYDPHIFRVMFLALRTTGRATRNMVFWRGFSCSPAPLRAARQRKDIVIYG